MVQRCHDDHNQYVYVNDDNEYVYNDDQYVNINQYEYEY